VVVSRNYCGETRWDRPLPQRYVGGPAHPRAHGRRWCACATSRLAGHLRGLGVGPTPTLSGKADDTGVGHTAGRCESGAQAGTHSRLGLCANSVFERLRMVTDRTAIPGARRGRSLRVCSATRPEGNAAKARRRKWLILSLAVTRTRRSSLQAGSAHACSAGHLLGSPAAEVD
jgi:hypothetical protein